MGNDYKDVRKHSNTTNCQIIQSCTKLITLYRLDILRKIVVNLRFYYYIAKVQFQVSFCFSFEQA